MSWTRYQVARVEIIPQMGGLHVTGWDHIRHCGCFLSLGMRMDKQEITSGITPCREHEVYCRRAMETMKNMPPQDEPIAELFERLFEHELVAAGVR